MCTYVHLHAESDKSWKLVTSCLPVAVEVEHGEIAAEPGAELLAGQRLLEHQAHVAQRRVEPIDEYLADVLRARRARDVTLGTDRQLGHDSRCTCTHTRILVKQLQTTVEHEQQRY